MANRKMERIIRGGPRCAGCRGIADRSSCRGAPVSPGLGRLIRWTMDRSDGVLPETKCAQCGVEAGESTKGWTHCQECDSHYCPKCSGAFREEKEDIEQLKDGSAWDRMRILCPNCGTDMIYLGGT